VSVSTFNKIIEFCKKNNWKAPEIPKVNTDQLNKVLDAENLAFIEANSNCNSLVTIQSIISNCSGLPLTSESARWLKL
jgi:hypothetical protein